MVSIIKCNEIYYKCLSLALSLALALVPLVAFGMGIGVSGWTVVRMGGVFLTTSEALELTQ